MTVVYKERADPNSPDPILCFSDERSYEVCRFFSEIIQSLPAECWVAGGAVLSAFMRTEINDIDLYFADQTDLDTIRDYLLINGTIAFESEYSLKINNGEHIIDLVKVFRKTPQQTVKGFDITVCCAAVDQNGVLYYLENFFDDLNNKKLRFNKGVQTVSDKERLLQRLNKYGRKGFELSYEESQKFVKFLDKIKEPGSKKKGILIGITHMPCSWIIIKIQEKYLKLL